ncbi:hypothetical protein [Thauera humireducens]|uniref:hypothetical protein n=1 Tax=Thauera humireducens TaxID=1134435 RepID=UPI000A8697D1|nr:hypothetical protein [Thauera humireducens]
MTTPNEDWRPAASAKALVIIAAGTAAHQHLAMLGDRIQNEATNIDHAKRILARRRLFVETQRRTQSLHAPEIDIVARAEADVARCQARMDALLKQRDDVTAQHAPLMRLFSAAKDLSRKFDL